METKELLAGMEAAARAAGRIMLEAGDIRANTMEKEGHANFVTTYDKRVQAYLSGALGELLPEAKFIGEEDGAGTFTDEDRRGYAFCVDPIDGTTNFVTGFRPSVTSIALLRDGAPYLGVVYNPYHDLMFTAARGEGAYCNGEGLRSSDEPLSSSLVMFGTAAYNPERGRWRSAPTTSPAASICGAPARRHGTCAIWRWAPSGCSLRRASSSGTSPPRGSSPRKRGAGSAIWTESPSHGTAPARSSASRGASRKRTTFPTYKKTAAPAAVFSIHSAFAGPASP